MEFRGSRGFCYRIELVGSYSGSGHYDNPVTGSLDKFRYQFSAFIGAGGLSGSEEPVASEPDYLLQGLERIAAFIEGAVEGDTQRSVVSMGYGYQPAHHTGIYAAVCMQRPDHYTGRSEGSCPFYGCRHLRRLLGAVHEITATRPYKHVHRHIGVPAESQRFSDSVVVGCDSANLYPRAEFYPSGSAGDGPSNFLRRGAACFQQPTPRAFGKL